MYRFKLEKFEGPLGLLLELIEKEKLEIIEISLAKVTEDFLLYVRSGQAPEEELADFLVVAARLLLLKSRSLLPNLEVEEDGLGLEEQLRMYKEFVEAAKKIEALIKKRKFAYFRETSLIKAGELGFCPPKGLKVSRLQQVFVEILARIEPIVNLPKVALEKVISIKEKIQHIQDLLDRFQSIGFTKLLNNVQTRTEIIVSFLALLELVKQRSVSVVQTEVFEEIVIKRN